MFWRLAKPGATAENKADEQQDQCAGTAISQYQVLKSVGIKRYLRYFQSSEQHASGCI